MEFSKMRMSEMVYFPEPVFNIIKDFLWGLPTKANPTAQLIFNEFTDQMIYFCTSPIEGNLWAGRQDERWADKGYFPFSSILDATKNSKKQERSTWCNRLCKYPDESHLYKMLLHSREVKMKRMNGEQVAPTLIEIMVRVAQSGDPTLQWSLLPDEYSAAASRSAGMCAPHLLTNSQLKTYLKENGFKVNKIKRLKKKALIKLALSF
jgi:hypothetical protein